ncbi:AraC family transcriptional regulator [Spirochaeta thermophila]|uniref:Transcriptional regulator, AraC family n=1 Tax=Winmispira thermophila (strain ATCC 49972 / DSM 6192 / RI 19.B1) TaxID=665571 RepID=E0RPP9_WINT6|nr:helix-turn-helix domain-containing protein [Spirochaeta thermophila]ADN01363.1 transcriptional regulator, AraC family [Spirochaeta thermophila DSM 6192]
MRNEGSPWKHVLRRTLLFFSITAGLTIIVLTVTIYLSIQPIVARRLYRVERQNIHNAVTGIRLMQNLATNLLIQIYNDPLIVPLLTVPPEDPQEEYLAIQSLKKYSTFVPYLDSVYIYNDATGRCYLSTSASTNLSLPVEEMYDREFLELMEDGRWINSPAPIFRSYEGDFPFGGQRRRVFTYLYNVMGVRTRRPSVVAINISYEWITSIMESLDASEGYPAFILDREGSLIGASMEDEDLVGLVRTTIQGQGSEEGQPLVTTVATRRETYLLVYETLRDMGWVVGKVVPLSQAVNEIFVIRRELLKIGTAFLVAGLLVSFLLSNRLTRLLRSLSRGQNGEVPYRSFFKTRVLSDLLLKGPEGASVRVEDAGDLLAIRVSPHSWYALLACEREGGDEIPADWYAHLLEEVEGWEDVRWEWLQREDEFLLVVETERDPGHCQGEIFGEWHRRLERALGTSVRLYVAGFSRGAASLPRLYNQMSSLLANRRFLDGKDVFTQEDLGVLSRGHYEYPQNKEHEFLEALHHMDAETAVSVAQEVFQGTRSFGYHVFQSVKYRLCTAFLRAVEQENQFLVSTFGLDPVRFLEEVERAQGPEEVSAVFESEVRRFVRHMEEDRTSDHKKLVQEVCRIIEEEYDDFNLGVATLADRIGLSPGYLGQLFKKYVGVSMTDYINEVRVSRAIHFLVNTEAPVYEIPQMVGYTNKQHFHAVFKKYTRLTPNEFRKQARLKRAQRRDEMAS